MAAKKRGTAYVTSVASHQTGKTHVRQDRRYHALKPGMRVSANGKPYYENRRNRSDPRGAVRKKMR